jgi:hypothetical protein
MADFFSTLFGGGAQADAANADRAALNTYQQQANQALGQGYQTGQTNLGQAIGAYSPLSSLGQQYSQAGNLLMGSLGAGGPQATQAAQAAFQNNPGYQGAITAGLDAINRRRAATGMMNSGNADIDAQTFGQNLQNQQYSNWQQQLAGMAGMGQSATAGAATGQAGGYTNLANLAQQYAQNQVGVAGNVYSGNANANQLQAQGAAQGAGNILGAGLSLASLLL